MTPKAKGQLAALLMISAVVGVVLVGALRGRQGAPPASAPIEMGPPPEAVRAAAPTTAGRAGVQDLVSLSAEGVWTRIDPETGRLLMKMTWSRLDPREAGAFDIARPRAWIISQDRTVRIEAERGTLIWPSRDSEPEAGTLEGAVVVTLLDGVHTGDAAPPAERVALTVRAPSLLFQNAVGEIRCDGTVTVEGRGVKGEGAGVTARLSPGSRSALTSFRIERGGTLSYSPSEAGPPRQDWPGEAAPAGPGTPGDAAFYRAEARGSVRAVLGPRTLEAASLEVFARTVSGRLREGAIAPFGASTARGPARPPGPAGPSARADEDRALTLSWSGPLEVRLLPGPPPELEADDLALRASGNGGAPVVMRDGDSGAAITAASAEYSATRRAVSLLGRSEAQPIEARVPGLATLHAQRINLDLTSGIGAIPGPGRVVLEDEASAAGPPRAASWSENAAFVLDTTAGPVGAGSGIAARDITLSGDVSLSDGGSSLTGSFARARFNPWTGAGGNDHPPGQPRTTLSRLTVTGDAAGVDARGGLVRGGTIELAFTPDERGRPVPALASVRDGARAERAGEFIEGGTIDADLRRSDSGAIEVVSVDARGGARAEILPRAGQHAASREARVSASAPRIKAEPGASLIDLIGDGAAPVHLAYSSADAEARLSGPSMRINASDGAGRLTVFGPGAGAYDTRRARADEPEKAMLAEVAWSASMSYDDGLGRAEVEGDASATVEIGGIDRHEGRGDRVIVELSPRDGAPRRELLRATVESDEGRRAELELRRYAPSPAADAARELESLAALRGPSIELDAAAGRLRVVGAGLLLLEDRREGSPAPADAPSPDRPMRGTSLFTWDGWMTLDRAAGAGEMHHNVHLRHRERESGRITDLWAQTLRARVSEDAGSAPDGERGLRLTGAWAEGGVSAAYGALRLSGELLDYLADRRLIRIESPGGGRVTLHDEEKAATFDAEAFEVDLAANAYRAVRAGSIILPR